MYTDTQYVYVCVYYLFVTVITFKKIFRINHLASFFQFLVYSILVYAEDLPMQIYLYLLMAAWYSVAWMYQQSFVECLIGGQSCNDNRYTLSWGLLFMRISTDTFLVVKLFDQTLYTLWLLKNIAKLPSKNNILKPLSLF